MRKNLKQRFQEEPDEVIIEELLDVVERTRSTTEKMEAIKMIVELKDDHVC